MAKKEKTPVDGYSREEYQAGLDKIAAVEGHPLSSEIAQHRAWREEYGSSPYPLVEEEQKTIEQVEAETGVPEADITKIETDLKRQMANARREAYVEDTERESEAIARELLPRIEKIKKDTEDTLRKLGAVSGEVGYLGNTIIAEAETVDAKLKEKPKYKLGAVMIELFQKISELFQRFRESLGRFFGQDRYGHGRGIEEGQ